MSGYTKLFSTIVASTIWREPDHVRIVWITMLAMSNADGVVEASVPGLADLARVTVEQCEDALTRLRSPDPYSRTKDHEGRRIADVDGGFLILNRAKYREKFSVKERREYQRRYMEEYRKQGRDRSRPATPDSSAGKGLVNSGKELLGGLGQSESESESRASSRERHRARVPDVELPAGFPGTPEEAKVAAMFVGCTEEFAVATWNKAMSRGGMDAKGQPIRSWRHYLATEFRFEQNRSAGRRPQRPPSAPPDHSKGF